MADPAFCQAIMSNLAAINRRIENADTYFNLHPDALTNASYTNAYEELRLRQSYLLKARDMLRYLQTQCNTDVMAQYCYSFYNLTVSPFMCETEEQKEKYKNDVETLISVYPEWTDRVSFRAKNITKALRETNTRNLHFALNAYIALCVNLFLWLRQKANPIKDAKEEE